MKHNKTYKHNKKRQAQSVNNNKEINIVKENTSNKKEKHRLKI